MGIVSVDLAIIGAGPAGMAAAVEAAGHGLKVCVLDDQPEPGGQIYRAVERAGPEMDAILGDDYAAGRALADAFRAARVDYRPGSMVWRTDPDPRIAYSRAGRAETVSADRVLIAAGAMERAMPIPGATRPRVMGAGAAQGLLKASGLVPEGRVVLAGTGPLLLLVAVQLVRAGADVAAILGTNDWRNHLDAAPLLPRALANHKELAKGIGLYRFLRSAGMPIRTGIRDLRVEDGKVVVGDDVIPYDLLLLHDGIVPRTHLPRQLGIRHVWHGPQRHWHPDVGPAGRTEHERILIAGDCAGIAGAGAAALSGRIAGRTAAGRESFDLVRRLERAKAARPLLDTLFPPTAPVAPDDAVVCRCESLTGADIRRAARDGAMGPNQMKAFARAGMGPCQGRMCALATAELIADTHGLDAAEVGVWRVRPPVMPVTLGELAAMDSQRSGG